MLSCSRKEMVDAREAVGGKGPVGCSPEEWKDFSKRLECARREPQLRPLLGQAARDAISECQILFQEERWNCSVDYKKPTLFGQAVIGGERERDLVTMRERERERNCIINIFYYLLVWVPVYFFTTLKT